MKQTLFPFNGKRPWLTMASVAFVLIGTYNSVVVNSDSFMDAQRVHFVKRLDEVYGVVTVGRQVASPQGQWVKLTASAPLTKPVVVKKSNPTIAVTAQIAEEEIADVSGAHAAIREDLELSLIEVFNAKKYPHPPKAGDFVGGLRAKDGLLESIEAVLPSGEKLSVSYSEMVGNVFEYTMDSQILSGMVYQMDKSTYMVTLTNGPLEGTRLKFAAPVEAEENFGNNSAEIAENNSTDNTVVQAEEAVNETQEFAPLQNDDGTQVEVSQFGTNASISDEIVQNSEVVSQGKENMYQFSFDANAATAPTTF